MENYKNLSMVDVAYSIVKECEEPILFADLYKKVVELKGMSEEEMRAKIASFYTQISVDGRFVDMKDNFWDLRERQTYDKVHIDMNDVYSDIDEETKANTDEEELDEEEKAQYIDEDDSDEEKEIEPLSDEI